MTDRTRLKTLREALAPFNHDPTLRPVRRSELNPMLDPYDARTADFLSVSAPVLDAPYPEGAEAAFTGGRDVGYSMDDPRMSRFGNGRGSDAAAYRKSNMGTDGPHESSESFSSAPALAEAGGRGGDGTSSDKPIFAVHAAAEHRSWGVKPSGRAHLTGVSVAKHNILPGVYHVKHDAGSEHVHLAGYRNDVNGSVRAHTAVDSDDQSSTRKHPLSEYGQHYPVPTGESKSSEAVIHSEAYHTRGGGKKRDVALGLPQSGQSSAPIEGNIVGAAYKAQGGRTVDFKHQDGSVTRVHPAMGRAISSAIQNAPNRERADLVQRMHRSGEHLRAVVGEGIDPYAGETPPGGRRTWGDVIDHRAKEPVPMHRVSKRAAAAKKNGRRPPWSDHVDYEKRSAKKADESVDVNEFIEPVSAGVLAAIGVHALGHLAGDTLHHAVAKAGSRGKTAVHNLLSKRKGPPLTAHPTHAVAHPDAANDNLPRKKRASANDNADEGVDSSGIETIEELSAERLKGYLNGARPDRAKYLEKYLNSKRGSDAENRNDRKAYYRREGIRSAEKRVASEETVEGTDVVDEAIKGWKHAGADIDRARRVARSIKQPVHLHRLNRDGSESGMNTARKSFDTEEEALKRHAELRRLNPGANLRHALYVDGKKKSELGEGTIDELSKETLGSYVRHAAGDLVRHSLHARFENQRNGKGRDEAEAKNRRHGIAHAVDRLTREEAETIDELSAQKHADYEKKSKRDLLLRSLFPNTSGSFGKGWDDGYRKLLNRDLGVARSKRLRKEDLDDASPVTADATGDAGILMTQLRAIANKAVSAVIAMPDDMKPLPWVCDAVRRANEEIGRIHDCIVYGDHPESAPKPLVPEADEGIDEAARMSGEDRARVRIHRFPDRVEHEGKTYVATGKKGIHSASRERSAEYEEPDKNTPRVWLRSSGKIERE